MHDLVTLLGPARTASTGALSRDVDPRSIRRWLATGRLMRLHPGWVTVPELADDWIVRAHAATGYTGGLLSHWSALHLHGLMDEGVTRLDVTVPVHHRLRSSRWLRIHRTRRPCSVALSRGLAPTALARSLVDTWGDAHGTRRRRSDDVVRNVVLRATRDRQVTVSQIEAELSAVPRLPGRAALIDLLDHVRSGAQSHLEIIGLEALRAVPGLPAPHLQYRVLLPDGPVRLDAAWPEVRLAVEFDGMAFHSTSEARMRDLRRDAALAAVGWVVLRFSYADVIERPAFCGVQVATVYRQRYIDVPQADIPVARMPGSGTSMS